MGWCYFFGIVTLVGNQVILSSDTPGTLCWEYREKKRSRGNKSIYAYLNTNWCKHYKYRIFLILPLFRESPPMFVTSSFRHCILYISALWRHSLAPKPCLQALGIFHIHSSTQGHPLLWFTKANWCMYSCIPMFMKVPKMLKYNLLIPL